MIRELEPEVIEVATPDRSRSYTVVVDAPLEAALHTTITALSPRPAVVALVSDDRVHALYGARIRAALARLGAPVIETVVPAGEASKTPARLLSLCEGWLTDGLSRGDLVVALGGGVVTDLAGLAAGLYMRGLDWLALPTSLLAQVDASVGGKVAVDLPGGKNLLGLFCPPVGVLADVGVLATLDEAEFACGLAEMLKHALLFDPAEAERLVADADALWARDPATCQRAVARSVALKAACVAADPFEDPARRPGRAVLNLGHTLGHALEWLSGYELRHGHAVALGLLAAARVSGRLGLASAELAPLVLRWAAALRLPTELDPALARWSRDELVAAVVRDKKRRAGRVRFVGLRAPGAPELVELAPAELVDLAAR